MRIHECSFGVYIYNVHAIHKHTGVQKGEVCMYTNFFQEVLYEVALTSIIHICTCFCKVPVFLSDLVSSPDVIPYLCLAG